jgi:bifunctional non-homologous end joining protein LigD
MRLYALVEAGDRKAIDVFLAEEDAQRALEDCLRDEPQWQGCFVSSTSSPRRKSAFDELGSAAVASAAPLAQPMLARSGPIPTRGDWTFELKWEGFRALLSTENGLRIRSRRGWDMTNLLPELSSFPVFGIFDGELVAFDTHGNPDFPLVCERMLMRLRDIQLTYVIFDVLSLDGESLMRAPYSERRAWLEDLELNGVYWRTPDTFDDGEALFEAVCERELEGIVAKRVDGRYRPGERGWTKIKNRDYWRYELERESGISRPRQRMFV